jgi:cytochrome c-type biogenesis protein CcmH/NrfF
MGGVAVSDPWDPRNPQNKERTHQLQRELRARLMEWDPIGIAGVDEPWDEYDCLLSPIMHMLHDGASERQIGDWLMTELKDHFGLRPEPDREERLADNLVVWWRDRTAQS